MIAVEVTNCPILVYEIFLILTGIVEIILVANIILNTFFACLHSQVTVPLM